jgi:hypothetical protein
MIHEQRGVKNTYDRDFEYLEVNEQDLNLGVDPDLASEAGHDAIMIKADNKRRKGESSPVANAGKSKNKE